MTQKDYTTKSGKIIQINAPQGKEHRSEIGRGPVQETLHQLLDEEADRLCNARRYERSSSGKDPRAGYYRRTRHTRTGEVELKVPTLRTLTFETALIERDRRRESSVEEALIAMDLAGGSVRRVEDIPEALGGTWVRASPVSRLHARIDKTIEEWRKRSIEGEHPYGYLDGISLKRSRGGEGRKVRNVLTYGPQGKEGVLMLKAIHAQEERREALRKAKLGVEKLPRSST